MPANGLNQGLPLAILLPESKSTGEGDEILGAQFRTMLDGLGVVPIPGVSLEGMLTATGTQPVDPASLLAGAASALAATPEALELQESTDPNLLPDEMVSLLPALDDLEMEASGAEESEWLDPRDLAQLAVPVAVVPRPELRAPTPLEATPLPSALQPEAGQLMPGLGSTEGQALTAEEAVALVEGGEERPEHGPLPLQAREAVDRIVDSPDWLNLEESSVLKPQPSLVKPTAETGPAPAPTPQLPVAEGVPQGPKVSASASMTTTPEISEPEPLASSIRLNGIRGARVAVPMGDGSTVRARVDVGDDAIDVMLRASPETALAAEQRVGELREALNERGLKLGGFEVAPDPESDSGKEGKSSEGSEQDLARGEGGEASSSGPEEGSSEEGSQQLSQDAAEPQDGELESELEEPTSNKPYGTTDTEGLGGLLNRRY